MKEKDDAAQLPVVLNCYDVFRNDKEECEVIASFY